jgi:16S rRNA (guanine966-N2)-methyltransferase
VETLGLTATVVDGDVRRFLAGPPSAYDLVLVDPPYELDVDPVLAGLRAWVADGGVLVLERRTRGPAPAVPPGFTPERDRRYGEATLWYFSAS